MRHVMFASLLLGSAAQAETTAVLTFESGSTYSEGAVSVSGEIVRGEWVQLDYAKERMDNLVLQRVYGLFHCYGYGPGCEADAKEIQVYYRFANAEDFSLAQGDFINIPYDAEKLELFFYAPETEVTLTFRGNSETRQTGEQYDSQRGQNYNFYF